MAAVAVMSRFEWERLVRDLPSSSPLFAHDERCGSGCWRKDGSRLSPATLKHVAQVLATYAQAEDGSRVFPGIGYARHRPDDCPRGGRCETAPDGAHEAAGLVRATGRHRSTIIAALAHLEGCGLIAVKTRANRRGVPRHWANEYTLTVPSEAELARRGMAGLPAPQPDPAPLEDDSWPPEEDLAPGEVPQPAGSGPGPAAGPAQPPDHGWRDWFTRPGAADKRHLALVQAEISRARRAAETAGSARAGP